jgi:hypothetical protein
MLSVVMVVVVVIVKAINELSRSAKIFSWMTLIQTSSLIVFSTTTTTTITLFGAWREFTWGANSIATAAFDFAGEW